HGPGGVVAAGQRLVAGAHGWPAAGRQLAAVQRRAVRRAGDPRPAAARPPRGLAGSSRQWRSAGQAAALCQRLRRADAGGAAGHLRPDGGQAGLMRILLVGAGGFIGRHLLDALTLAGHEVVATRRAPAGPPLPGVQWRSLDLLHIDDFAWPDGIELVLNASGELSTDSERMQRLQRYGACALFELARQHGAGV